MRNVNASHCLFLLITVFTVMAMTSACEPTIEVAPTNTGGTGGMPETSSFSSSSTSSGTSEDAGVGIVDAGMDADAEAPEPCFGVGTWTPINASNEPRPRSGMAAAWTGSKLLLWGGGQIVFEQGSYDVNEGSIYDSQSNTWSPMSTMHTLRPRWYASGIWTGTHFLVWGGGSAAFGGYHGDGAAYQLATDSWSAISSVAAPSPRYRHTAVWTGTEMIVWGGYGDIEGYRGDGARYDPLMDTWKPMNAEGAPTPRYSHSAIWTGREMLIWGGYGQSVTWGDGAAYDPMTDSWRPIGSQGAPSARRGHSAIWTGSTMLIWGGQSWNSNGALFSDGAIYDPLVDTWTSISTTNAPEARVEHPVLFTGTSMIIWGGSVLNNWTSDTGGIYDIATDSWEPTSNCNVPGATGGHTAVWTGQDMLIFGGVGRTPLSRFTP
ncbi:MAG TPA: hypothetical protein PK156_03200 [Polyangium sp.]|nr:hypothetical protein [Polyangium sp.]